MKTRLVFATLAVGMLVSTGTSAAQLDKSDKKVRSNDNLDDKKSIEKIVITSSKIDRLLSDLEGFAITTDQPTLQHNQVRALDDLQKVLPGLSFHQRGNRAYNNVTLRGQSSFDFYGPKTQLLLDGLPEDQAMLSQLLPATVAGIEALYGPQGTLYGRGTIGGVINVITRKPGEGSNLAASAGWDELSRSASVVLGGSLIEDTLYADFAASLLDSDGEYRQIGSNQELGERKDTQLTVRLRYAPVNSPWDLMFSASRVKTDSTEEQYVPVSMLEERRAFPVVNDLELNADRFSVIASYDFGKVTLKSLTSYQDREMHRTVFGALSPEKQRTLSQEIRLSSNASSRDPLAYVVGLYFEDIDFEYQRPAVGLLSKQTLQDKAAFAELTWSFAENMDVTAGLRVDRHSADAQSGVPGINLSGKEDFSAVTPKIALGWDLSDTVRLYGLYSSGFKPGGFTRLVTPLIIKFSYEPEEVDNYEIGARASLLDNSLNISASAYWMENKDFQLFVGGQPNQYLQNVGAARSKGLDMSIQAELGDGWFINSSLAFNQSTFTEYSNPLTPGLNLTGNRLPHAPRFKANVNLGYRLELGNGFGTLTPSVLYTRTSQVYFDETNTVGQGGFGLYDLNLQWQTPWQFSLSAYISNIGDETYRTYGFNGGSGLGELYQVGQGRRAGIRISTAL